MLGSDFNFNVYRKNRHQSLLSSICPWEFMIDEGIAMLKGRNGALCCAYEFIAPDLYSSSRSRVNSVAMNFNNSLIQLGEGWTCQFELQRRLTNDYPGGSFNTITGYLIDKKREENFNRFKAHYQNRYFLIFTYELPNELVSKGKGIFYKKAEKNVKPLEEEIKYFKITTGNIVSVLQNIMHLEFLNSNELFTLFCKSVSLNWHDRVLPEEYNIFLDRIVTDSNLENSQPLKLGEYYIPIIAINSFTSRRSVPAMFDELNKVNCELRWSTRFICYSKQEALRRVKKAEDKFHGKRKSIGTLVAETTTGMHIDKIDESMVAEEADATQAKIDITMGIVGFGDYTSNVMVWSKDLREAEELASMVSGTINACNFGCKIEEDNALQAFLSMQPGNIYANERQYFISTGNLSHVIPISSIWAGMSQNKHLNDICGVSIPHLICGTDYDIPFFLNLNVRDVGHTCILGPTGAGKSTLLNLLEVQWTKYKETNVIIFDSGKSARKLTMCIGGTYIEPGVDDVSCQPLAELDTTTDMQWAAEFIELLLTEQKVEINAGMRKAIFETLKLLSTKTVEARTLTSFAQYCDYQDPDTKRNDITDGISPYILGGQYGSLFDSVTTNIPIKNWTMIEMKTLMELSKGAVAPSLFYLFRQCEKRFTGIPTLLVLDEAQHLFKNPMLVQKLGDWLRMLRKVNVFVIIAFQEIAGIMETPIASTVISQCPTKIYLADPEAETPKIHDYYEEFGLTDSEIYLLTQMSKKKDYFYKSSMGTRKFQLDLDDFQLAILTNSSEEHEELSKLEEEKGKNTGNELVIPILEISGFSQKVNTLLA